MLSILKKENCTGCYACVDICKNNSISMKIDREGFWYPIIDKNKCINCNMCERVCPVLNSTNIKNNPVAYGCYNLDENIRFQSSSGGLFTLIAEQILKENGIVFGAEFDNKFNVRHNYIDSIDDLNRFRKSKYVQSKIGNTYIQVEKFLKDNRKVLFSGTPCQIAGLKSYLKKEYENLFCIDFICHGVPSPKVWTKYVDYILNLYKSKLTYIDFRAKSKKRGGGNGNYSMLFFFEKEEYRKPFNEDLYMIGFLNNLYLRPSCYSCKFKSVHRISDITLADFWGVENVAPELYDDRGTSLILINSSKGILMFDNINRNLKFLNVDIRKCVKHNISLVKSSNINPNRKKFFDTFEKESFDKLIAKCSHYNIFYKIKSRIYSKIVSIWISISNILD